MASPLEQLKAKFKNDEEFALWATTVKSEEALQATLAKQSITVDELTFGVIVGAIQKHGGLKGNKYNLHSPLLTCSIVTVALFHTSIIPAYL